MKKGVGSPFTALWSILDRISGLLGAFVLSQFPQFFSQYMQRLGGHLREAERTLDQYLRASRSLGLTLQEYIDHHMVSQERVYSRSGEVITQLIDRYYALEESTRILQEATPLNRWFYFIREGDWMIVQQTWQDYTPGVPTTWEGAIYALTGLLLGWGIFSGIRGLVRRLFFRKRSRFEY